MYADDLHMACRPQTHLGFSTSRKFTINVLFLARNSAIKFSNVIPLALKPQAIAMASTFGSDTASDIASGSAKEQVIRDIVLAAGEKAGVDGLCEQCNQIVGWFFLDREVYKDTINVDDLNSWYKCIRDLEIDKFSRSCKLCSFIWAMGPDQQEDVYLRDDVFHLCRATVGAMFDFRSCYLDSPIFYLSPPNLGARLENEVCRGPGSNSPIFGFANADPTRDGVAIRTLAAYADLSLIREWIQLCDDFRTGIPTTASAACLLVAFHFKASR